MALDWKGWIRSETLDDVIARKDHNRAIELIRAELRRTPKDRRLRLMLADALAAVERRREAVDALKKLADDLVAEGHAAQAIAVTKRIRTMDPAAADAIDALGRLADGALPARAPVPEGEALPTEGPFVPTELTRSVSSDALVVVPLFGDLARDELLAVAQGMKLLVYAPGQIVVTEGEAGDSLYAVSSGHLRAFVRDRKGRSVEVATLGEGDVVGEMSLLTGRKRTATLVAASRCELLQLDKAALAVIVKDHPKVRAVLRQMYQQREQATAKVRGRKARPTPRAISEKPKPPRRARKASTA